MEDYQQDIMIGEGPAARSIKLGLPPFTLVGVTTRAGLLTSPLRDRFGIVQRLEYYSCAGLTTIIQRSASLLNISTSEQGAREIARRAREGVHPESLTDYCAESGITQMDVATEKLITKLQMQRLKCWMLISRDSI